MPLFTKWPDNNLPILTQVAWLHAHDPEEMQEFVRLQGYIPDAASFLVIAEYIGVSGEGLRASPTFAPAMLEVGKVVEEAIFPDENAASEIMSILQQQHEDLASIVQLMQRMLHDWGARNAFRSVDLDALREWLILYPMPLKRPLFREGVSRDSFLPVADTFAGDVEHSLCISRLIASLLKAFFDLHEQAWRSKTKPVGICSQCKLPFVIRRKRPNRGDEDGKKPFMYCSKRCVYTASQSRRRAKVKEEISVSTLGQHS